MGGGDLNLKKSWHPQTLRNVEKVWKAEQKADAEAKKIEQLQRELNEEREREEMQRYAIDQGITKKKSDRLEWMYSAPGHSGINHEDYLLGKAIDKAVDPLAANEQSTDAPGASFMEDAPNASADLATKIRDDPLFMIKKKETEKKKELLKNPVRMKQLQNMLKAELNHKDRKKSKKEKKKRKNEKKKHFSDDITRPRKEERSYSGRPTDSESSDDTEQPRYIRSSDKNIHSETHREKLSSRTTHDEDRRRERKRMSSFSPRREEPKRKYGLQDSHNSSKRRERDNSREKHKNYSNNSNHILKSRSSSRSPSPVSRKDKRDRSSAKAKNERFHPPSRSESLSPDRERTGRYGSKTFSQSRRDHSPERKYGESRLSRKRHRSRSHSPHTSTKNPVSRVNGDSERERRRPKESGGSRKMTEEDRERKLAEMMDNAKWRDEQRGKNVKKYKDEDENEEKEMAKNKEKGASFVKPMKVNTYTSSTASVENRIKRNINSLQRTPAALENFLKK